MTIRGRRSRLGQRFGFVLARLRRAKRWSRYQLARRAGVSDNYVRLLEHGDNVPTLAVIVELAGVLGVTPAELVREATEEPPPAPAPPPG